MPAPAFKRIKTETRLISQFRCQRIQKSYTRMFHDPGDFRRRRNPGCDRLFMGMVGHIASPLYPTLSSNFQMARVDRFPARIACRAVASAKGDLPGHEASF